jgi:hypothetical protein
MGIPTHSEQHDSMAAWQLWHLPHALDFPIMHLPSVTVVACTIVGTMS